MTAAHVLHNCIDYKNDFSNRAKIETKIGAFHVNSANTSEIYFDFLQAKAEIEVGCQVESEAYPGPLKLDIGVIAFDYRSEDYLEIKVPKPGGLNVLDEIIMCGYPGTWQSMFYRNEDYSGIRLEPITQIGRIAGLLH